MSAYNDMVHFFCDKVGVNRQRLEMAIHDCERLREPVTEAQWHITTDARNQAIYALAAYEPRCMTVSMLYQQMELYCRQTNPLVIPAERSVWEREFKAEVDGRIDELLRERKLK